MVPLLESHGLHGCTCVCINALVSSSQDLRPWAHVAVRVIVREEMTRLHGPRKAPFHHNCFKQSSHKLQLTPSSRCFSHFSHASPGKGPLSGEAPTSHPVCDLRCVIFSRCHRVGGLPAFPCFGVSPKSGNNYRRYHHSPTKHV